MNSLEHLKVGDKVVCNEGQWESLWRIYTITGETKTRWKTQFNEWRKKDGRQVGRHWDYRHIHELTPELQAKIDAWRDDQAKKQIMRQIRELTTPPENVSLARLKEIYQELGGKGEEAS